MVGPELGKLSMDCRVVMQSTMDPDPAAFDDREWIASVFTEDGRTIEALVHSEYQGHLRPAVCALASYFACWSNAITAARSTDGGDTFVQTPPKLVASVPYQYLPGAGPYGFFEPSNVVQDPKTGYFFVLMMAQQRGLQQTGTCVMRTRTPSQPSSWRAWDGRQFSTAFVNPYVVPGLDPARHLCAPVSSPNIVTMHESVVFDALRKRFLLVGVREYWDRARRADVPGIYLSESTNFTNWSPPRLLMEGELPWTYSCGDRHPILYPSLIDPASPSRTFATTGDRAYLYFTQFNYHDCRQTIDRDLMRVPVNLGP
jgi:hypothetical protein